MIPILLPVFVRRSWRVTTVPARRPAEAPARTAEATAAEYCDFLRLQIGQAEQTLRQLAMTLNATGRTEPPVQVLSRTAFMDHWTGRFSALVDATTPARCLEAPQLDQARQIVAQYTAFAAQARDFAMRPADAAAAAAAVPPSVQRRRDQRQQQRRELELQQSLLP